MADRIHHLRNAAAEHDIGTAACHVRGNRHSARTAGFGNDLGFTLVLLRVEDVMRNAFLLHQVAEELGIFNRCRTDEDRLAARVAVLHVLHNGVVLFLRGLEDLILLIDTDHRTVGRDHDGFQAVNVLEFVRFGISRTGHAGQLVIHTEVVLEGDGGHRHGLLLHLHVFLRFDSLVNTVAPAAARHQTAREFVDDDHFAVLHHVFLVALEERVSLQRGNEVMHQHDVLGRVEAAAVRDKTALGEDLLHRLVTLVREVNLVLLLIHPVVARFLLALLTGEERRNLIHRLIEFDIVFSRTRNDERRSRLVNQNRVHFVDDRIVQRTLTAVPGLVLHVVTEIVETEFVIRTVGDIGGVGGALHSRILLVRQNHADRKAEPLIELPHPLRVTAGEVIVHGHHVHALAGQRVQVNRERGGQRLAFAGAHFSDLAVIQHHAADHLHIEVAHAKHSRGGFTHNRESFRQQVIQRFALLEPVAEFLSLRLQLIIGELLQLRFQFIDLGNAPTVRLHQAVISAAKNFRKNSVKHIVPSAGLKTA